MYRVLMGLLAMLVAGTAAVPHRAEALQGTITGRVLDAQTQQPISTAQVFITDTGLGALSRLDGTYQIQQVPAGIHTLSVQRIGYGSASQQVSVVSGQSLAANFELVQAALQLDEMIVTGTAGQARRREVGNAIVQLSPSDLPEIVQSVETLLQGRAAGVTIRGTTGNPGAGSQIRLRGITSASMGNQPLIYVDGVRMRSEGYGAAPGGSRSANVTLSTLDDINPADIERIEIIKGPAATTLYGTEAAAGVIQIFTKRGLNAPATWTFETQQGFSRPRELGPEPEPFFRMDPLLRTAYQQEYHLAVSGGSGDISYYFSGNRSRDEGIWGRDLANTTSWRSNLRFQPMPSLVVDFNTGYTDGDSDLSTGGRNPEGPVTIAARGPAGSGYGDGYVEAMHLTNEQQNLEQHQHLITGLVATLTQGGNLTHRLVLGLDNLSSDAQNIRGFGFLVHPDGDVRTRRWSNQIKSIEYVGNLQWEPTESLALVWSAGSQFQDTETASTEARSSDLAGPGVPTAGSGARYRVIENRIRVVTGGVFGQVLLGYQDRYFLTLGTRLDGNSAFGEDLGFEAYPKVAASYVISDESWWSPGLGETKLRAAYGEAGRAPGAFDAVRTWETPGFLGVPAFAPGNVGNPNLAPERSKEIEVGFDHSMFDSRLNIDFTYYRKTTDGALFLRQQIPSEGFGGSQLENVGKVRNSGIELSVDADLVRSQSVVWSVGGTLTTNHSLVLDIGGAAPTRFGGQRGSTWIIEGQPLPVVRAHILLNPDELSPAEWEDQNVFGPNYPTHIITGTTTLSFAAITLSARGEFLGGFYKMNSGILDSTTRGAAYWCEDGGPAPFGGAYSLIDQGGIDELTALVRSQCAFREVAQSAGTVQADFFRLRDVSIRVRLPLGRLGIEGTQASFALSATNWVGWNHSDIFVFDPDYHPGGGDGDLTEASNWMWDHSPLPKTLTASLRVQF